MKLSKKIKTVGLSLALMLGVGSVAYGVSIHTGAQPKIESSVVSTYNKIQDGVVSGYKQVENFFVPSEVEASK